MNRRLTIAVALLSAAVLSSPVLAAAWSLERVDRDVWLAVPTNSEIVGGNVGIIATSDGLVLVDAGGTVRAAHLLLEEIAREIRKPVRYVIDTHFHHDHTLGNAAFPPEVPIIAHTNTRRALVERGREFISIQDHNASAQIRELTHRLSVTPDPGEKKQIQLAVSRYVRYREDLSKTAVRPPDFTFEREFRLHLGGSEVICVWPGRGHTEGNILVYLPEKKMVFTGDFLLETIPYMGDAFLEEWIDSLKSMKSLEFDLILPGHGLPFGHKDRVDNLSAYISDLLSQLKQLTGRRTSLEEVLGKVDLHAHWDHYPALREGIPRNNVARAYKLITGRDK